MAVKVLGPLDTGDAPLSPRERAILAALIVRAGQAMSQAELAEACWGETAPPTWAQQVKTSVARIRSRLGSESVRTYGSSYSLGIDDAAIDSVRFEQLVSTARERALRGEHERAAETYARALALWRGSAYPDLADWEPGVVEALRLAEIRSAAEEELLEARLRSGLFRESVPHAEQLVREQPLREDRWALLARALYGSDRQADALAMLRAARARLRDELGIEPGERLRALEAAILHQDPALRSAPPSPTGPCPYPGLRAFGPGDAETFLGREEDVAGLRERVRPGAVVALVGASGSGKSSVVRAGLVPALIADGRPAEVVEASATRPLPLPPSDRSILVIDQAEQLLRADEGERDAAAGRLAAWVEEGGCLILTLRSDFLDEAAALPALGPLIARGVYALGPLTPGALRRAIEEPARRAGLRVGPGLVELILHDAGSGRTTMPLVAHALVETWRRREGGTLSVAGYTAAGGIAGAVGRRAEELFATLTPAEQRACRALLLRLVQRGGDGVSMRRRVAAAPLLADAARRRILERLVDARLVTADGDAVVIAHEALADAWPRLDAWLEEDADEARLVEAVSIAAGLWHGAGRTSEDLWRGSRLQAALEWRESTTPDLTEQETRFLDESAALEDDHRRALAATARRDRTQNRRLRWALAAAAALLLVASAAGGVAVVQGRDAAATAEDARISAVTSQSLALLTSDRDTAALLAAEAYRRWPDDPRTASALMGAATANDGLDLKVFFDDTVSAAAAAIPGTREALVVLDPLFDPQHPDAAASAPRLELWSLDTGERLRTLDAVIPLASLNSPRSFAFTGDGRLAAVVQSSRTDGPDGANCCVSELSILDLETGRLLAGSQQLPYGVSGKMVFDATGATLTLLDFGQAVPILVDTATGAVRTAARPGVLGDGAARAWGMGALPDGRIVVGTETAADVYAPGSIVPETRIPVPDGYGLWDVDAVDADRVVMLDPDGVALVRINDGEVVWHRRSDHSHLCNEVLATPSHGTFWCVGYDSELREALLSTGEETGRVFATHTEWVMQSSLVGGEDGILLASQRSRPGLYSFRLDGGGTTTRLVARGKWATDGFSADGREIIVVDRPPSPDAEVPAERTRWSLYSDTAVGAPEDDLTWAGGGAYTRTTADGGVELVDAGTGAARAVHGPDVRPGASVAVFPARTGDVAFAATDGAVRVLDPRTGVVSGPALDLPDDVADVWSMLSTTVDGRSAVATWWSSADGQVLTSVIDLATGRRLADGLYGDVASIAAPGGLVVSVNSSGVTVSDESLRPVGALPKPVSGADTFSMSRDGTRLLLTGDDADAILYDVRSGRQLGVAVPVDSPFGNSGYLSPDGRSMVTNTAEGVLLWDLDPAHQALAACRSAGRELTAAEWATVFGDEQRVDTCRALSGDS